MPESWLGLYTLAKMYSNDYGGNQRPCEGDSGSSLMITENNRSNFVFCIEAIASTAHDCTCFFRYIAAAILSKCFKLDDTGCCDDPIIYHKLDGDMKRWIWQHAEGVRESTGCPKPT